MRPLSSRAFRSGLLAIPAAALFSICGSQAGAAAAACAPVPDLPSATCDSVQVPLDRADPGAGSTTVAYAVVPRRDRSAPAAGTVLFNPGGPGDAPIERGAGLAEQFAPLLEHRDLLLIDPRGTGRSDALTCSVLAQGNVADVFDPNAGARDIAACGRELGTRAAHYGSTEVADDFDAVRAELGIERLDLWGNSYGAYLMPVYAARHPGHVRSMVLSSSYPMDFDPFGRDRLSAARHGLRIVCERTRACHGDAVLRDVATLAQRLRYNPVAFSVPVGAERYTARLDEPVLAPLLYGAGNPYAFGTLPAIAASGRAGDLAPLRRVVETQLLWSAYGVLHGASGDGLPQAFSTMCHDYPQAFSPADPPAARRAAYDTALRAIGAAEFFPLSARAWTAAGFEGGEVCIDWPENPTAGPPLAPGTPMPDVPVLVLSGELDANTPSEAGRAVAQSFPHATFAEIPNAGHVPTDSSPCALQLALTFIETTGADAHACDGTGTPPPVTPRAAQWSAELPPVQAPRFARRALAVVVATAADLREQSYLAAALGSASGLRGGRYVSRAQSISLDAVQVVRDATASGQLATTENGTTGTLRLSGIARGTLAVELGSDGHGRATGTLDGRRVRLAFTYAAS